MAETTPKDTRQRGRPTDVYRLYGRAGELLYVGITHRGELRLMEHRRGPFAPEIASVEWEHFPTRLQAKRREKELIAAERPRHNVKIYPIRVAAADTRLCAPCVLEGVDEPATRGEWCELHYRRRLRHGDAAYDPKPLLICSADPTCGRTAVKRGWCIRHYRAWQKHGDPTVKLNMRGEPAAVRFWLAVDLNGPEHPPLGSCWMWQACLTATGYGVFSTGGRGKNGLAHHFSYKSLVGPVPAGLVLDHLCRNRACVNPAHLEPVTPKENSRRRWESKRATNAAASGAPRFSGRTTGHKRTTSQASACSPPAGVS